MEKLSRGAWSLVTAAALTACPPTEWTSQPPSGAAPVASTASAPNGAVKTVTFPVEGMTCASCVATLRRALLSTEGVSSADVDLVTRSARVEYLVDSATPAAIASAIADAGYTAGAPAEVQ